jgi:DeoR family glycerol-3-phosphate regulon repressor
MAFEMASGKAATTSTEAESKKDGKSRSVLLRQSKIVDLVRGQGFVSIDALAQTFMVTPQTIRRDINELSKKGLLHRHHGGAGLPSSVENVGYTTRKMFSLAGKIQIARLLARHIPNEASLFLDIGTTTE